MRPSNLGTCLISFLFFYHEVVNASLHTRASSHHGAIRSTGSNASTSSRLSLPLLPKSAGRLTNVIQLNMRGGGPHSPSTDPTRTLWSSSSVQQPQPTSLRTTSSSYRNNSGITVTDVTDDVKDFEREQTKDAINAFLTRESRNSFIVKVYTILTGQLVLVALSALLFGRYPTLGRWMMTSSQGRIGEYDRFFVLYCIGKCFLLKIWHRLMHFICTLSTFPSSSMGINIDIHHDSLIHDGIRASETSRSSQMATPRSLFHFRSDCRWSHILLLQIQNGYDCGTEYCGCYHVCDHVYLSQQRFQERFVSMGSGFIFHGDDFCLLWYFAFAFHEWYPPTGIFAF
jgi:hypothetical protein